MKTKKFTLQSLSHFKSLRSRIIVMMVFLMLTGIRPVFSQGAKDLNSSSASGGAKGIAGKQNWSTDPFEHKMFIENKGQFDNKNAIENSTSPGGIKYGITNLGMEIYFTPGGLTYRHDEYKELSEDEIVSAAKPDTDGENEKGEHRPMSKLIPHLVQMDWIGANPNAQIVPGDAVSTYFTYPDMNDKSGRSGIKASAFTKITYLNLYPLIDVVYTFPENKSGVEYSLILHPGADASVIKMRYSQMLNIHADEHGNILIETAFGNIVDHAPVTYFEDGTPVKSGFQLADETVSFNLSTIEAANHSKQSLIIDPWTTPPTFSSFNSAYDVDHDNAGNVYVYGGAYPWQEIKFNSLGIQAWVYTGSQLYSSGCSSGACYGDFAIDATSSSSYIVEAFNGGSGTRVLKLDAGGNLIGTYPGNSNFGEMWRVQYNNCTKQAIIAGGGTEETYQACLLDTNVTNMTPINVLSASEPLHDFALLAIDNYNNVFMATARSQSHPTNYDNVLLRCPASTLVPVIYSVSDNHSFIEVGSVTYVDNITSGANGFNGMTVDNRFVYTYDGSILKKWNKNTGVLVKSVTLSSTPFTWGGLDINACGDIFVGSQSSILQLDSNLTTVASIPVSSTIYDLKLGQGNIIYAAGAGFVSSINLTTTACGNLNLSVSSTNASCISAGTATVTPNGGVGPFTYSWSSGQSTQSVTGLIAGTYTVTVVDNGFTPCSSNGGGTQTTTVTITGTGVNATAAPDTSVCAGFPVQLSSSPIGTGYLWSPGLYLLNDSTIANPVATVYSTTTFTVTVTSGACSGTATVTVNVFPYPNTPDVTESATFPEDTLFCAYDPSLIAHQWYIDGDIIPGATGLYYVTDSSGNYNVAVTDTNGCQISVGINIILKNVGVQNLYSDHSISFFPNPANDQITIKSTSIHANESVLVSITDMLGKTIQQERINWGSEAIVNIKNLSSGIYFLQLQQPQGKWIGRFVKE